MHVQCFLHLNNLRHWFQDRMKQSLAWSIILTVCLYGKPSLSSPGTNTCGGGWVPWARWVLGSLSLCLHWASEMPQHLDPRGKGCRQCSCPWAEGSPPTILCPWPGAQMWTIPASQGLLKIELPKQCVCGLACVPWDRLTGYPTPLLLGMDLPSCQLCFFCLLVSLISSWYGATCYVLWRPTEAELYLAMFPYKRSVLLGNVGCTASREQHG